MAKENLFRLAVFYGASKFWECEQTLVTLIENLINIYVSECKFDNYIKILKLIEAEDDKKLLLPNVNSLYFALMDFCDNALEHAKHPDKIMILEQILQIANKMTAFSERDADNADYFNKFIEKIV